MTPRCLSPNAAQAGTPALVQALSESRERWRLLVHDTADLAFETDESGRFVLLAPEFVLGWPVDQLLGTPASALLFCAASAVADTLFDPFRTQHAVRGRRVWLRDASGLPACLLICAAPIAERPGAVRGIGIDVTAQEDREDGIAAALRRHETAGGLARRMREAALPFASLGIGLDALVRAVDAQGATLLLHEQDAPLRIAAAAGQPWAGSPQALNDAVLALCEQPPTWLVASTRQRIVEGRSLLLCGDTNHFIDRAVLALWRTQAAWSEAEAALAAALMQTIQPILEHEQIQRQTARMSRTDILTGLFNRQGLLAELARRFERLDRDGQPAVLMIVGLDKLAAINAASSLEGGDTVLRNAATLLRDVVRPTDLVARLGGDLFALWLDNADQFTAAERADQLCRRGIAAGDAGTAPVGVSIGLAVRASRSFESVESLLHRAWRALQASKRGGGGRWHVSTEEASP